VLSLEFFLEVTYSQTNVGTLATSAALVAIAALNDGMAEVEISEA